MECGTGYLQYRNTHMLTGCTHVVLSDELHQDVSHQGFPVCSRESLLQRVPERQMSLQQLLHKLHQRLTDGEKRQNFEAPELT